MTAKTALTTILVADDHSSVLETVVTMLAPVFCVVGTASDGKAAVEAEGRLHPDVVVMGYLNASDERNRRCEADEEEGLKAKIVFLTMHQDSDILAASNLAGGLGHVVKGRPGMDLVRAIEEALAGHSFVSPVYPE